MITITLDEFVDHGGHFRISFSEDGTDQFVNPTAFDDFYNDPSVLLDDIPDNQDGGIHEIDFVVPDVNCNPCTIQALQVMSGGSFSEGSLYYNCADIVIEGASQGTTGGSMEGGSATSASTSVTVTDTASATNGNDTSSGGGEEADGSTTASIDDNGDETPAETGDSDGTAGNSVTLAEATTDTNEDEEAGGCACSSDPRPNAVWALPLFVIALARRRR
jgi:MYXO-CTERM domain-containing protein